eukprot:scpid61358/ scgid22922/ SWI/SNF-related matrix-associated actin-dependent regulator of chromatin subfamily B member 1
MRTSGPKPKSFRLEESGEEYMIGSEAGAWLKMVRGSLYKRYPGLWRRMASIEERKIICGMGIGLSTTSITLLKACEVEDMAGGDDEQYKGPAAETTPAARETRERRSAKLNREASWSAHGPAAQAAAAQAHLSSHMDAVPSLTVPAKQRTGPKRLRTYPHFYDDNKLPVLQKAGEQAEVLVPIRLDLEIENHKLRDTFLWNKNESMITPEQFAELLCDDMELPSPLFVQPIANAIRGQVEQHPGDLVAMDEEDRRVPIKLNIHVGNISLVDQFEWDLSCPHNSPEEFARQLCSDLGLGGEFVSTIAYSIRGQISWNARTMYAFGDPPLPTLKSVLRTPIQDTEHWCPRLEVLTEAEMEKKIRDQDRNTRRMRRLAQGW